LIDPRLDVIAGRFSEVRNIIAVSSGKGGVGKSMVSVSVALSLLNQGFHVGLLDLDFTSPSTHLILGAYGLIPEEDRGILPPEINGLKYMSIVHYSLENPTPLRGVDISNTIIEILAITRWEKLDYLIIDMPPGLSDATLDLIRLIPRITFLVVTTPSRLAFESVRKLLMLLLGQGVTILGLIENMVMVPSLFIESEVKKMGCPYIGSVDFDSTLEPSIGNPKKLRKTRFYKQIEELCRKI